MKTNMYQRPHTIALAKAPPAHWPPGHVLLFNNGVGGMSPLRDEDGKVVIFRPPDGEGEMRSVAKALGFDLSKLKMNI